MVGAHAEAILSLLRSIPNVTVYDGIVPDRPALPYVVAWITPPRHESDRMTGDQLNADNVFQTTASGLTPESVRIVVGNLHRALVDARVAVEGRNSQRIKHLTSQPIRPDEDVSPPLFYGVDQWSLFTVPAPA